jgi:hypothetical protein
MPSSNKRLYLLFGFFVVVLSITGYLGFQYFSQGPVDLSAVTSKFKAATDTKPAPSSESSSKPVKNIGSGEQTFQFSHGPKVTGPKPQQVSLNPIDPQQGQPITITLVLKNDSPITKADTVIHTDNDTQNQAMKLIEGDKTNGTWQLETKIKDTYLHTYKIYFDLQSTTGNYNSGLTLRQ